jgi:hypothetical protein
MAENFPNLEMGTEIQIKEAQQMSNRVNPKGLTQKHSTADMFTAASILLSQS